MSENGVDKKAAVCEQQNQNSNQNQIKVIDQTIIIKISLLNSFIYTQSQEPLPDWKGASLNRTFLFEKIQVRYTHVPL